MASNKYLTHMKLMAAVEQIYNLTEFPLTEIPHRECDRPLQTEEHLFLHNKRNRNIIKKIAFFFIKVCKCSCRSNRQHHAHFVSIVQPVQCIRPFLDQRSPMFGTHHWSLFHLVLQSCEMSPNIQVLIVYRLCYGCNERAQINENAWRK